MGRPSCWLLAAALLLPLLVAAGCASITPGEDVATAEEKGGSQIWTECCSRCHILRSPSPLSDAQWEAAVLHMRVRSGLTAQQQRRVLQFLQSGN